MRLKVVTLVVLAVLACSIPLISDEWQSLGQNAQRLRKSAETGVDENLTLAWKYTIPSGKPIISSPVVSDGIVIFGAEDGKVYALDIAASNSAASPVLAWGGQPFASEDLAVTATPVVDSGAIYVAGREGHIYCLDILTGRLIWQSLTMGKMLSSPVVSGNYLVVGSGIPISSVIVYNKLTGVEEGRFYTDQPVNSSPAVANGIIYIGDNSGKLYAIDLATRLYVSTFGSNGAYQTLPPGNVGTASPLVYNNAVYFAPGGNNLCLYQLDAVTGAEINLPSPISGSFSSAVSNLATSGGSGGVIYLVGGEPAQKLFAFDANDLSLKWEFNIGNTTSSGFASSPAVVGNRIFVGSDVNSRLYVVEDLGLSAVERSSGSLFNLDGPIYASPAVANGMVFVATGAGSLYAFQSANRPPLVPDATTFSPQNDVNITNNQPIISWTAVTDPDGDAVHYEIRIDSDGEVLQNWMFKDDTITASGGSAFYTAPTPVADNTRLFYRVRAIDSKGAMSNWSGQVSFFINRSTLIPPTPPTNFVAIPQDGSVNLVWTVSTSSDVMGYRMWYKVTTAPDFLPYTDVGNVTNYTVPGLTNGINYTFMLKAIDFDGNLSVPVTDTATPQALITIGGTVYPTVESAVAAAVPGDTIVIGAGTFNIGSTLVVKEGVNIAGFSALYTRLDGIGLNTLIQLTHTPDGLVGTISNLMLTGAAVGIDVNSTHLIVKNNVFTNLGTGVAAPSGSVADVINNTFVNNVADGISITQAVMELRNNIIIRNSGFGVSNFSAAITGGYNDLFGNALGSWLQALTQTGNISSDVTFLDEGNYDFREALGQAIIDAGLATDVYQQEPSPNGGRINMGAFGNTRFAATSGPGIISKPGGGGGGGGGGGCFIATAALGTVFEGQLAEFYGLRDKLLRTNLPGTDFVNLYYKVSPPVANYIRDKETLKFITRKALEFIVPSTASK